MLVFSPCKTSVNHQVIDASRICHASARPRCLGCCRCGSTWQWSWAGWYFFRPTPWKNRSSSIGMIIIPNWMEKYVPVTTNQLGFHDVSMDVHITPLENTVDPYETISIVTNEAWTFFQCRKCVCLGRGDAKQFSAKTRKPENAKTDRKTRKPRKRENRENREDRENRENSTFIPCRSIVWSICILCGM